VKSMAEPQIALFVGDAYRCERGLADRESTLLADDPDLERHVSFGDEIEPGSLRTELRSASLFALGRHFVIRQPERCRAPKALAEAIDGEVPAETLVTLLSTEMKTTHPIYKLCKARDAVVPLPSPRGRGVAAAARKILAENGIEASTAALQRLVFRNGGDLLGIAQEAAKLRSLCEGDPLTEEVVDRVVFPSAERTVFPFFDRLGERNLSGALAALSELRDDPGRMVGGAVRHLARLTMIRIALDAKNGRKKLSEAVGLPDWLCRRLVDQAKRYRLDELARTLRAGIALDVRIKRGEISPEDALLKLVFATARPT